MFIASDVAPQRRKGRGKVKGHKISTKVANDGKYGPWFDSVVGIHTRDICDLYHNAWKDVDPQHKRKIQDRMLVFAKLYYYKFIFKLNTIKPLSILIVL